MENITNNNIIAPVLYSKYLSASPKNENHLIDINTKMIIELKEK